MSIGLHGTSGTSNILTLNCRGSAGYKQAESSEIAIMLSVATMWLLFS